MARGNKNRTVLDLIAMCEKKGTIRYSNKIDNFVKLLTCVSLKSSKNGLSSDWETDFLCLFAVQDEVTGEKSSNLRGNYLRQRRLPKYGMLTNFS